MADTDAAAAPSVPAEEEAVNGAEALHEDATAAVEEIAPSAADHKRKLGDLEPGEDEEAPPKKQEVATDDPALAADESGPEAKEIATGAGEAEPARLEGEIDGSVFEKAKSDDMLGAEPKPEEIDAEQLLPDEGTSELAADRGHEVQKPEAPPMNGQLASAQNVQQVPPENLEKSTPEDSQQGSLPSAGQQPSVELATSSDKIEVPNSKVGVLIGKAGDTIKYLQINSGAKIQITRDAEADPHSTTRPVELIGTVENINKAKQLIKDVIAEADAGGSPSLVARGFSTVQSGGEQTEIKVPNEKVGLIIGKGGETIKNLQTRSGARIQLIPQHLPEGDSSKERTVRITGNKKQIESAKEMIKEVMNQLAPTRPSPLSGGYSQQGFRPRGPTGVAQWGSSATVPTRPTMGNDYQQRGMYPPLQTTQYPQPYGSYSQQPPPRGGYGAGWDQKPVAPVHSTHPSGGYDYYGQGGQAADSQPSNPVPNPSLASTPASVNYNYGQSQAPVYGQPTPYAQPAPTQQNYGHGYNEPKYDNQATSQQFYGQQPMGSQPGVYGQQAAPQPGYGQQQAYSKPSYGAPPQEMPPSYGPPRASQPGDPMYQGSGSSSYGSSAPTQQSYPYSSSAPSQQPAPAYNQTYPASGAMDGYPQPPLAAYSQHSGPAAPGYGQSGQPVPAYTQPGSQPGGYGQYPSSQQGYVEPVSSNVNYGYHGGSADAGYGNTAPSSGYGVPPPASSQPGYAQPPSNPSGYYEQSVPSQTGFGNHPGTAPVGYVKSASPQPGYGGQYDSAQMYGHH